MIEQHLDIPTAGRRCDEQFHRAPRGGRTPSPVVLFYMDAPGKHEEVHDMARRLAAVATA
jgi:carboxymethylenebutenolidase